MDLDILGILGSMWEYTLGVMPVYHSDKVMFGKMEKDLEISVLF